jgi:Resolvase, N terminal domain
MHREAKGCTFKRQTMSKITTEHLSRSAIVYVRQSTSYQVVNNLESQRRQYGLVERGHQLGWSDVQVIDDDLGRSGGGIARPGFEKLLAAICEGRVGAVLTRTSARPLTSRARSSQRHRGARMSRSGPCSRTEIGL